MSHWDVGVTAGSLPPSVPTTFTEDVGVAVPVANNLNIIGGVGITTSGSGSTVTISLTGGGAGIDEINVDAATAPGTDPVVPNGSGSVAMTGGQVASSVIGANVIRTNSLAANSLTIEVQQSGSAAAQNTALNGVSHYNSTQFTVSNGFVSLAASSIVQTIIGGPGITITGTAANPIVNSVIFTNQAGSTTVTSNSGSFATAAITLTLPAAPAQGDLLEFVATTAGALVLDAPSTHLIRIGNQVTSAGGTMTSTAIGDSVTLRYRAADTTWYATSSMGSFTPA